MSGLPAEETPFHDFRTSAHRLAKTSDLLRGKGDRKGAIAALRNAVRLQPDEADLYVNLGVLLFEEGSYREAIGCQKHALMLNPALAEALNNLGIALRADGRLGEAEEVLQEAVSVHNGFGPAHYNLGSVLFDQGRLDAAESAFHTATDLMPASPAAWTNLGLTLYRKGNNDAAVTCYRQALNRDPDYVDAHWNLSHALLLRGDMAQGWAELEWRWSKPEFHKLRETFVHPDWDGRELSAKTLFVFAEQGFGDLFQFVRYLPAVCRRQMRVVVEVPAAAADLVRSIPGVNTVIARGDVRPPADACCGLLSLPYLLGGEGASIPSETPYLRAPAQRLLKWKQRIDGVAPALRVGIVWSGSSTNPAGSYRSIRLHDMVSLFRTPGVQFFSLQKGESGRELRESEFRSTVVDWSEDLHDFSDTAALIHHLDLVISIDTGVVHLAGALGQTCWTLLPQMPDWRWQEHVCTSPWYPTMRLYRQQQPGEWTEVINRVVEDLAVMRGRGSR